MVQSIEPASQAGHARPKSAQTAIDAGWQYARNEGKRPDPAGAREQEVTEATRGSRALAAMTISICSVFGATGCKVQVGNNVELGRMAATGPETWEIDGKAYSIGSTYYLVLPPGEQLQYTIEYLIPDQQLLTGLDDERAARIAMPLMKRAWKQRLFERSKVTSAKGGELKPAWIGVALTVREGAGTRGFRVRRSIEQIAAQD